MIKVYWRILTTLRMDAKIEFWTKQDKSNALTFWVPKADNNEKIRKSIEDITGNKFIELIYDPEAKEN